MGKQNIIDSSSSSSSPSSSSWVRGMRVGRGCFGAVNVAVRKSDGRFFAVKSVDLATSLPVQAESLENEIRVLRSLEPHPCVVRFLGDDVSKEGTTSYRNLHLEYLPRGTVADVAADGGVIDEGLIRRYAWCLVSALRYVHSHGIVHCDVKGKNVLIGPDPSSVKLADFGSSIQFGDPTARIVPRGSPLWMAPEVIRGEYQGPESDVWSLGCTVIEMFTGKPAWEDHGVDSLSQIGFSDEVPRFPTGFSELGRDFLDKCLKRDPNQRWRCDQLLHHPFLSRDHYSSSPRCVLDWVDSGFDEEEEETESVPKSPAGISAMARICKLATTGGAIWETDDWVKVRDYAFDDEEEGTSKEHPSLTRANEEIYAQMADSEIDSSESQSFNMGDVEEVAIGSTVGLRRIGGYRCRYGPRNVGCVLLSKFLVVENILKYYSVFVTNIVRILHHCHHHNDNNKIIQTSSFNSQPQICFVACDSDRTVSTLRGVFGTQVIPSRAKIKRHKFFDLKIHTSLALLVQKDQKLGVSLINQPRKLVPFYQNTDPFRS